MKEGDLHLWWTYRPPGTGLYAFYTFNHYTNHASKYFCFYFTEEKI